MSCPERERVHALMDGALRSAEADEVRDHLAGCAICQAELADAMQLDAMVAERGGATPSIAWYRRRKVQLAGVVLAAAAAAAIVVTLPRTPPATVAVALAPQRMTEARLAWPGAAQYRRYDVPRAGEPPHEAIDLMTIARLEQRGDTHGVGVLEFLNGERRQAAAYLENAGDGPGVLADRAALALEAGQPVQALRLVDAALERDAWHGPALWNRALALRDLGLPRAAAIAFRAVAERGEAGWADEARQRADALDREADTLQQRFERINRASVDLAQGVIALAPDDAHAMPGLARGILYDAIRSATTPAQLAQLQPLADAIDSANRDTAMADAIRRAAPIDAARSQQYADMIRALAVESGIASAGEHDPVVPAGAARAKLVAELRAAHADDQLIGVLMKVTADRRVVDAADVAELGRLTAASPDPWMQLLGLQQRAEAAIKADDLVGAEAILLAARARCGEPHAPAFRCIRIGSALADVYLTWQRVPEAHAVLESTWQLARTTGEWILQSPLLEQLATLASIADDAEASGQALVRAYMAEDVARQPASPASLRCDRAAFGRLLEAQLLIDQLRFAEARRALTGPACDAPLDADRVIGQLYARAKLAAHDGDAAEIRALRADVAARRAHTTRPAEQVALDHIEGLAALRVDRAAGEALLRRAIATARTLPESLAQPHKLAAWSYSVLVDAAGRARDGDGVLALLVEEQGLALPARCALGVAILDERRTIAVRDAAGRTRLHTDATRRAGVDERGVPVTAGAGDGRGATPNGATTPGSSASGADGRTSRFATSGIDAARFVPPELAAALQDCATVDVIAEAPLHGRSRLLPDTIAWRYLSRRARPLGPSPARSVVVTDVEPPAALELPRLASWTADPAERLAGPAATPSRVLSAIGRSGEAVIHAHGLVDGAQPDAAYLALSPEPDGRFALTTREVRAAAFASNPLVILAACRSSSAAPVVHDTWSLPAAFIYAGARGVIASTAPIPDGDAGRFFDGVRARIRTGIPIATALRDERTAYRARGGGDWVRDLIVFE